MKDQFSVTTLAGILKDHEKIENTARSPVASRVRSEENPDLEKCLYYCFSECKAQNLQISEVMI